METTETVAAAQEYHPVSAASEMVENASWAAPTVGAVVFEKTK